MTDMIERLARAIAGICNEKGQELASKCKAQAPLIPWQAFEREARAAIEAMRKPTPLMQAAGSDALGIEGIKSVISYGAAGRAWQAMIDAALEGKK